MHKHNYDAMYQHGAKKHIRVNNADACITVKQMRDLLSQCEDNDHVYIVYNPTTDSLTGQGHYCISDGVIPNPDDMVHAVLLYTGYMTNDC